MKFSISGLRRFLIALAAIAYTAAPANAESNSSAQAPAAKESPLQQSFRMAPESIPYRSKVRFGPIESADIDAVKRSNSASGGKRLQVGIGRRLSNEPAALSSSLRWTRVQGGEVAQWDVTSPGARAIRLGLSIRSMQPGVEIRFGTPGGGPVYGPFSTEDILGTPTYWSPVLEGEVAVIEIFVSDGFAHPGITITQISHFLASPSEPNTEAVLKNGLSDSCHIDLICRSPDDTVLANIGKSVARMTYVDGADSYFCTGTLLNPKGGNLTPYFYSAHHCISTQDVASTLTTHWFYDRTRCGSGGVGRDYVQLPGGATLIYSDGASDALLLRLNRQAPAGALYSGWDANPLATGAALTAVHHPKGDWKKVSIGSMGAFVEIPRTPPLTSGSFIQVNWTSGVTEKGSSGSGIFTRSDSSSDFWLRGGLKGGPSSCAEPTHDFYSRLDLVYPYIRQFLNPADWVPLNVSKAGVGSGLVTSSPAGINCGGTCNATFRTGSQVTLTAAPLQDSTFIGWSGAGCSGVSLTCTVSMTAAQNVTARFALDGGGPSLGSALDNNWLTWSNSGNAAWSAQSQVFLTGGSAVRSGLISGNQVSTISTTVTGPGVLSFWWKVSSEASFDFLTFYIDGVAQAGRISGEVDWTRRVFNIPAGTRTLEWRYSKDASVNAGLDAAWLDRVSFSRNPRDFNADGKSDLIFQNTTTGQRVAWFMNGTTFAGTGDFGTLDPVWQFVDAGDFNGDGKPDMVLQNTSTGDRYVWFLDGTRITGGASIANVPPVWQIAVVGDFDNDAKPDLVFQNTSTGQRVVWFMNGASFVGTADFGTLDPAWEFVGTGDFNADGKPDMVLQNTSNGDRYVWFLDGTRITGGQAIGNAPVAWSIAGTGDYNGDGRPDIVLQNTSTGDRVVWFMNGASYSGGANLGNIPPAWSLVP